MCASLAVSVSAMTSETTTVGQRASASRTKPASGIDTARVAAARLLVELVRGQRDLGTGVSRCGGFRVELCCIGDAEVCARKSLADRGHTVEGLDALRVIGIVFFESALEAFPIGIGRHLVRTRTSDAGLDGNGRKVFGFGVGTFRVGDVAIVERL